MVCVFILLLLGCIQLILNCRLAYKQAQPGLLNECLPQAQYSAISSTVTLSDDIFKNIKQGMEDEGLWNEELEQKLFFASQIQLSYL